jgi:hypothetical protein
VFSNHSNNKRNICYRSLNDTIAATVRVSTTQCFYKTTSLWLKKGPLLSVPYTTTGARVKRNNNVFKAVFTVEENNTEKRFTVKKTEEEGYEVHQA